MNKNFLHALSTLLHLHQQVQQTQPQSSKIYTKASPNQSLTHELTHGAFNSLLQPMQYVQPKPPMGINGQPPDNSLIGGFNQAMGGYNQGVMQYHTGQPLGHMMPLHPIQPLPLRPLPTKQQQRTIVG